MEEKKRFNKRLNIKVPPTILTNRELMDNEKLILSLDYTFSLKIGFNIMTNVDIGKLLSLHENIVGLCRKSLIKKGYLVKDLEDKRIHRLTDKLNSVVPIVNEKTGAKYESECILPFEIYNHNEITTGAKLLWGEYNTLSRTEDGYIKKRETTSIIMNVSVGSITNWTKQLSIYGFLKEYEIKSEYYKKQKVVRTIEFSRKSEDYIDNVEVENVIVKQNLDIKAEKSISKKDDFKTEEEVKTLALGAVDDISELYGVKQSENNISEEENGIKKAENKGGITKYSDLLIAKKGKKKKDITEEKYDVDFHSKFDFKDFKE
jgi:hypothetical protein